MGGASLNTGGQEAVWGLTGLFVFNHSDNIASGHDALFLGLAPSRAFARRRVARCVPVRARVGGGLGGRAVPEGHEGEQVLTGVRDLLLVANDVLEVEANRGISGEREEARVESDEPVPRGSWHDHVDVDLETYSIDGQVWVDHVVLKSHRSERDVHAS